MGYRSWPLTHPSVLPTPATHEATFSVGQRLQTRGCKEKRQHVAEATKAGHCKARLLVRRWVEDWVGLQLPTRVLHKQLLGHGLWVRASKQHSAGASRRGRADKSRALQGKAASLALGRAPCSAAARQATARQGCKSDAGSRTGLGCSSQRESCTNSWAKDWVGLQLPEKVLHNCCPPVVVAGFGAASWQS